MSDDGINWDDVLDEATQKQMEGELLPLPQRLALFIIDEDSEIINRCPEGHIVEWQNKTNKIKMAYIYRFTEKTVNVICLVCGWEKVVAGEGVDDGETPTADSC